MRLSLTSSNFSSPKNNISFKGNNDQNPGTGGAALGGSVMGAAVGAATAWALPKKGQIHGIEEKITLSRMKRIKGSGALDELQQRTLDKAISGFLANSSAEGKRIVAEKKTERAVEESKSGSFMFNLRRAMDNGEQAQTEYDKETPNEIKLAEQQHLEAKKQGVPEERMSQMEASLREMKEAKAAEYPKYRKASEGLRIAEEEIVSARINAMPKLQVLVKKAREELSKAKGKIQTKAAKTLKEGIGHSKTVFALAGAGIGLVTGIGYSLSKPKQTSLGAKPLDIIS